MKKAEIDTTRLMGLLARRSDAVKSLLKSLKHLSRAHQYSVLTSYLSLADLEAMAKLQVRK